MGYLGMDCRDCGVPSWRECICTPEAEARQAHEEELEELAEERLAYLESLTPEAAAR